MSETTTGKSVVEAYEEYKTYCIKRQKEQGYQAKVRNMKNHILPYIENKTVNKITKKDIIEWENTILERNFSDSFNNSLYCNFKAFLDFCVLNDYITVNVVSCIGNFPKKVENKDDRYYTKREYRKLRRHIDGFIYKEYFNFMFFHGTRPSEAMALRFCDLDCNYIKIQHNLQRRGERKLDTPKNQSSIRELKLSLLDRFRIFKLRCYYMKHYDNFSEDFYIFGGNKPLSTSTLERRIKKAAEKANLDYCPPHKFRHSYTTNCIHSKKSIEEVSKNLGHSKVSTTLDVYLHMKKRVTSTLTMRFKFLEQPAKFFKNISQSIITFFM